MTPTQAEIERGAVIDLVFNLYPPTIRNALLCNNEFITRFNIQVEQWVKLGGTEISALKPQLHELATNLFNNPNSNPILEDRNSVQWIASLDVGNRGVVLLKANEQVIRLPSLWMLMPDKNDRINELENLAKINGFSKLQLTKWKSILCKRPANNDEVDLLFQEIADTITNVERNIEEEFTKEEGLIRDFVPLQIGYYENLVGQITQDKTATEFFLDDYKQFLDNLEHLPPKRQISTALLSCWHSRSAKAISEIECDFEEMVSLVEHTAKYDNACAIAGLAEICLYKLKKEPRYIEQIGKLIDPLLVLDTKENSQNLLSSICMFVDAELATSKLFQLTPPFYRRLAALSHACLLERIFREMSLESPDYPKWCEGISNEFIQRNGSRYYFQNLCDMREEPHWVPDHISPESLKREFLGRLMGAADQVKEFIPDGDLKSKLLEDVDGGLRKHLTSIVSFVPGPLEGAGDNSQPLQPEIEQMAITQLEKETIDANSFIAIVNVTNGMKPNIELAELAAAKLEDAQFYLRGFEDEEMLWGFIGGIALLSAKTRCHRLTLALRRFVSRMLAFKSMPIDVQQLVRSGLIAAAAFEDLRKWSDFLGTWFAPIAFGELSKSQALEMHHLIKLIISYVPISNIKLAPSLAALEAFQKS